MWCVALLRSPLNSQDIPHFSFGIDLRDLGMRKGRLILLLCAWGLLPLGLAAQAPVAQAVGPALTEKPMMRIGLLADAQYCDFDAENGRFYRLSIEKLHQAVDTFNAQKVDMVINLGDLIDRHLMSYGRAMAELRRLQMPVHHILGNHEFWAVPFQLQEGILDSLGLKSTYCDMEVPGWRFLMLDGTELAEYAQGAHRDLLEESAACRNSLLGHNNAALWNGAIGREQMAWIDWQLKEAEAAGEQAILFCHFPISPPGHPMTLWNEADLRVLLAGHPSAQAWVAGHAHGGGYVYLEAVHHVTMSGMLMTADSNSFAIMNLYPDRIVLQGFGREPYRVLPLSGAQVAADTVLPMAQTPPDATPPLEIPCVDRSFFNPIGRLVFSEETDSLAAQKLPRLRPGYYGVWEQSQGQYRFRRVAVLPR